MAAMSAGLDAALYHNLKTQQRFVVDNSYVAVTLKGSVV